MTADEWKQRTEQEQCNLVRICLCFGVSIKDMELRPVETKAEGVVPFEWRAE